MFTPLHKPYLVDLPGLSWMFFLLWQFAPIIDSLLTVDGLSWNVDVHYPCSLMSLLFIVHVDVHC